MNKTEKQPPLSYLKGQIAMSLGRMKKAQAKGDFAEAARQQGKVMSFMHLRCVLERFNLDAAKIAESEDWIAPLGNFEAGFDDAVMAFIKRVAPERLAQVEMEVARSYINEASDH